MPQDPEGTGQGEQDDRGQELCLNGVPRLLLYRILRLSTTPPPLGAGGKKEPGGRRALRAPELNACFGLELVEEAQPERAG